MSPSDTPSDRPRPVERFKPTGGQFIGYAGLVAAAVTVGYVVLYVHTLIGLRLVLGALFFGVVVWVTQLRPRATAYPHHVMLRNSVRDARIPYVLVDEISMTQTLNIWVGDRRFVCIGIGRSLRDDIKARRRKEDVTTGGRLTQLSLMAERASTDERAMSYQTFVQTRLEELVDQAKRSPDIHRDVEVRHEVAWPEVAALILTALAFAVTLLL